MFVGASGAWPQEFCAQTIEEKKTKKQELSPEEQEADEKIKAWREDMAKAGSGLLNMDAAPVTPEDVLLLREIRDLLKTRA